MKPPKITRPRHRRPDHEKANPQSEYYVPHDPENRAKQKPKETRHEIRRKTRLTVLQTPEPTQEAQAWQKRLSEAQDANAAPPEPTDCPVCGLTPIGALAIRKPAAVIIRPGFVLCTCRPEPIDVGALLREQRGQRSKEERMILECWREQVNRDHEPGSESKGDTRDKAEAADVRAEQGWHGWAYEDYAETMKLEKLVFTLKGKVPKVLADRLQVEAKKLGKNKQNHLFRWLIAKHVPSLAEPFKVEPDPGNVLVEILVTRQHADLWAATKTGLAEQSGQHVSNADLMAAVMLREWV